jgi:hypothetical protein
VTAKPQPGNIFILIDGVFVFSVSLSSKYQGRTSLGHNCFVPNHFQSIIHSDIKSTSLKHRQHFKIGMEENIQELMLFVRMTNNH